MNSTPSLKNKKFDCFNIAKTNKPKPFYSNISLKKKSNHLKSLFPEKEDLHNLENIKKYNTYNINKIKNISLQSDFIKSKTRNKTLKSIFKYNSEDNIFEKTNKNKNNIISNNTNFLLLTSLYKLPSINNKIQLTKKPKSPLFLRYGINNNFSHGNTSSIISKKSFNDSTTSCYNDSFNNFINLRYNKERNNSSSIEFNQSNISNQTKRKKKVFSNLFSLLKDKYYMDVEKKFNRKLDSRLFKSDRSMKDKIIHMKKVSIFWNSVFKYCVPIINGKKYKLQHIFSEQRKLKELNLNQSHSNYYDIFVKDNKIYKIKYNKSKSLSKIL